MESNKTQSSVIHTAKEIPWKLCKKAKRIVIKIGTRALIDPNRDFDLEFFNHLGEDIERLQREGKEILIVSSGAVNAGVNALKLSERPRELVVQQVLAAVGNPLLIQEYQKQFKSSTIAQILVTQEDFSNRVSYNNLRNTMEEMLKRRIIPIVNENDVVSVNELLEHQGTEANFSDNDILAGLIAASMDADLMIILSDVKGLYTKHPNSQFAEFIPYISEITPEILRMGQSGSKQGRGGMASKIVAAQIVTKSGGTVIIAHAKECRIKDIMAGKSTVTFFSPSEKLRNKQIWLIFGANIKGKIMIDQGAKKAVEDGASLLFNGILKIEGSFEKGVVVSILSAENLIIARGKTNYSAGELHRFKTVPKQMRKEYFAMNNIREIISHENMAFTDF
jgi:glutamate 5-kinase